MTRNKDDLERLIADVENMSSPQRLLFVEIFLRSLTASELHHLVGKLETSIGLVHALKNINLISNSPN